VDENIPSPQEKGDREAVEEVLRGGGLCREASFETKIPLPPALRSALMRKPFSTRAQRLSDGQINARTEKNPQKVLDVRAFFGILKKTNEQSFICRQECGR
jgi:hypothetical protein